MAIGPTLFVLGTVLRGFDIRGTILSLHTAVFTAIHMGLFGGVSSELVDERTHTHPESKTWDRAIVFCFVPLFSVVPWLLDLFRGAFLFHVRWLWPVLLLAIADFAFFRCMRENNFFSAVTRLQKDRGHTVCDTGPYAYVRHPAYTGFLLGNLGFAVSAFFGFWHKNGF